MNMIPIGEAAIVRRPSNLTTSFSTRGVYKPMITEQARIFHRELITWRQDTMFLSSSTDMENHPSFKIIVALGSKIIPLIMAELSSNPDRLVMALTAITGRNPVPKRDYGNTAAIVAAWQRWFVKHRQ